MAMSSTRGGFAGVADVLGGGLPVAAITRERTALMTIDVQGAAADRTVGAGPRALRAGLEEEVEYFYSRVEHVLVPNVSALHAAAREAGIPLIHVRIMNQSPDSSDTSWRYKQFGLQIPPGSPDAEFLTGVEPLPGEIVLNKTTSSVFASTNADFILRNMGVDTIVICGVATNNCVESSARAAADLGYRVILVEDACAAWTEQGHEYCIAHLDRNFVTVKSTHDVVEEMRGLIEAATGVKGRAGGAVTSERSDR